MTVMIFHLRILTKGITQIMTFTHLSVSVISTVMKALQNWDLNNMRKSRNSINICLNSITSYQKNPSLQYMDFTPHQYEISKRAI